MQKSAVELQTALVDLVDLGLLGKQARWNVVGPQFRAVHIELDEVVEDSRKWADEVRKSACYSMGGYEQKAEEASEETERTAEA
jgi:DNA-binding ferritin-like protein